MFTPKTMPAPKIERKSIKKWEKGTVTAFDDGRTPIDGLRDSGNLILDQDGTVRPRPSLVPYGPQPAGTILGEIYEFVVSSGLSRTNWMICMQNVAGTTKVYVARGEDVSWTVCNGKTYDNFAKAHFIQIDSKVFVMNGEDYLSYLDTSTMTVVGYTALATPSAPILNTLTGLTGTSFNVYYAITANSTVGETNGSGVLTQQVLTDRDLWNPDTQSVKIEWSTVTGVKSWNVYMGISADGAGVPKLYAVATGLDPSILTFTDNGTVQQDLSRPLPTTNGTAGPRASRGTVANNRVFLVGDKDHPYYVWRGGDYGYELDFSPANGGGYTPVGSGTKDIPISVSPFRDGKGDAKVMILSQGTNGHGRRSYMAPTVVTYGSISLTVWEVTEDSGQDGTDSPDGVIIYQNSIWYPSRDGFKTTGTKPQLQNVLSTDRISNTIQGDLGTLNSSAMNGCVGLAFEGRLYWALPVGSTSNSQIWSLDIDRKGAWMKPWNIPADWMTLYNDNTGRTHFLVLKSNKLYELSYAAKTTDDGAAFSTSLSSGQVPFVDDRREWGRLIQLVFVLLRPQGAINFTVSGQSEEGLQVYTKSEDFSANSSRAGWSEPFTGWSTPSLRGWSEVLAIPTSTQPASAEVIVEVDEDLQWFQFGMNTTEAGIDYNLSDVVAEYVNVGIKDLT